MIENTSAPLVVQYLRRRRGNNRFVSGHGGQRTVSQALTDLEGKRRFMSFGFAAGGGAHTLRKRRRISMVLREHRRLSIALSVNLQCGDDSALLPVTILDVSFGGLGLVSAQKVAVGSRVDILHRDFPCATASSQATSKCRVVSVRPANVRSHGFRVGLAFVQADPDFVHNLLQWAQTQSLSQKRTQLREFSGNPQWL